MLIVAILTMLHFGFLVLFCDLQSLHSFSLLQEPTYSGAEHTNEDIRAPLTIGDVNIAKNQWEDPKFDPEGRRRSLVLIGKGLAVSPSPEPLAIVLAGTSHRGLYPIKRMEIKGPRR